MWGGCVFLVCNVCAYSVGGGYSCTHTPVSPLARLFGLRLYMGVDNSQLHIGGVKCIKDNNQVQLYDQIRGDTDTAHHYHFFGCSPLALLLSKIVPTIEPLIVSAKALAGQLFMTR